MKGVENIYTTVLTPSRSCSSWLYFILPFRSISTHCRLQDLTQSQLATEHSYLPVESSSLFFSNRRHSRSRWYLGIWYKKVSKENLRMGSQQTTLSQMIIPGAISGVYQRTTAICSQAVGLMIILTKYALGPQIENKSAAVGLERRIIWVCEENAA